MNGSKGGNDYLQARKLGAREFSRSVSKGHTGYLPFLEGILKNAEIVSEVDLGVIEVPLKKVVGTYTYSRSISFAANFMPLMEPNTEFAAKWEAVANHQQKEGITDPVKVYEYLNWFYVVEGNKRVSVLKYFGAYSVRARVSRLVPKKDETDATIKIYYEFMEFYKKTGINSIWFSREGSFQQLFAYLKDFKPKINHLKNKYKYISDSIYLKFRKIYHENRGGALPITTGDAFLEYIKIYGMSDDYEEDLLRQRLKAFVEELEYFVHPGKVTVKSEPEIYEENKLISGITSLIKPRKILRIAFAYAGTVEKSIWTYSHEMGRLHLEKELEGLVETSFVDNVPENADAYESLKTLAEAGNDVVFATSPAFLAAALKAAMEYPGVKFLNCCGDHSFKHLNTYFGKIYEPRFLTGIIAGVLTRTDKLGYVGTIQIPEVISGINSFALGARLVNPRAIVKVMWSGKWDCPESSKEITEKLALDGADFISHHNTLADKRVLADYGLHSMVCTINMKKCVKGDCVAAPVWNWGAFYEKIIKSILSDSWSSLAEILPFSVKPVNFWLGMDSGVLDIVYSRRFIPRETQKLVELMKKMIIDGSFSPFSGPVYDNNGRLRIEEGESATREKILSMKWFAEGVEGELSNIKDMDFTELFTGKI